MKLVEKKLEELYIVKDGTHDSPKYVSAENGFPFLTSKNLKKGFIDLTEVDYVSEEDYKKINLRSKVDKGDLLFAMIGTIGNPVVVEEEPNFAIKNVALFKKNTDSNSLHYLKYILSSESFKKKLINDSTGGTQKFVSLGYLRKLKIPIPEKLSDQIRIAQILSQAENLIAQRKQSISLLDELLKSTFLEMFGDPVRNEKGLKIVELGNLGTWKSGGTPSRKNKEFYDGDIPWITSGELNEMYISDSKEKLSELGLKSSNAALIQTDSLLLGMYDTAALKSSMNKRIVTCNQAIAYSKLDDKICNTVFIYFTIQIGKEHFRSQQRGVRQKNMNLSMIKGLKIILPVIPLQTKFANIVEKVEALKGQYQQSLTELQNMYGVLSQKAFKGELKGNVEITN
jgi:type I restriction enzyme S subunit